MATKKDNANRKSPPARSIEAREQQLIALAVDLAEKQLREGTATSQVITHYLKLGASDTRVDMQIKEKKKELLTAQTEAIKSAARVEELYAKALSAMRSYSGQEEEQADE